MGIAVKSLRSSHFLNRELSWLEFNQRVLDEALDPENPLLERVKFFCIASSNLDEFFEVRVAGLKQQMESEAVQRSIDGRTATETFRAIARRVRRMVDQQYMCWNEELRPALAVHGIRFLNIHELDEPTKVDRGILRSPGAARCSRRWRWTRRILSRNSSTSR